MTDTQQIVVSLTLYFMVNIAFTSWAIKLVLDRIHETEKLIIRLNCEPEQEASDQKKKITQMRKAYFRAQE